MIRFGRCKGVSRNLAHVVLEIIAPWGTPIEERPKVLDEAERAHLRDEKRERRMKRKMEGEGAVGES